MFLIILVRKESLRGKFSTVRLTGAETQAERPVEPALGGYS
jgi:hypothetical protein